MGLAKFFIALGPTQDLDNSVIINDQQIANKVRRLVIDAASEVDPITSVHLELFGEGTVEGEGIVYVTRNAESVNLLMRVLDAIDPADLERQALHRMEWGEEQSVVAIALNIVKEVLRGDQSVRSEDCG